jgi:uncharacterized membrane protein
MEMKMKPNKIKRYFITGLIVVVPIFLTIYVLVIVFYFFDGILGRILNVYFKKTFGFYIHGLGFLISLLVILLVGFLATRYVGKRFFKYLEKLFSTLPLTKNIYPTFKQIILFILQQEKFGFKKVVLVQYPSKGIWSIGFLTNENFPELNQITNKEMAAVFVPNTPGPLAGYVIFVPKEELKFPDISIGEALRIIISGGVFKDNASDT